MAKTRRIIRMHERCQLSPQNKNTIRIGILTLLQDNSYDQRFFKQLLRIIEIIARVDFPTDWQALASLFLGAIDQISSKLTETDPLNELVSVASNAEFLKLLKVLKVILRGQATIKVASKKRRF